MAEIDECSCEQDRGYKSSQPHPTMSSEGIIKWANFYRARGNTKEKKLTGEVPESTIESIAEASQKTGVPTHLLVHIMDFKQDITSGGDANSIAHEIIQHVNSLRSVMDRDPFHGEVLAATILGGAGKVKELYEKANKKPEQESQPTGSSKDDIIFKKLRNNKLVKRTNREVYEFFKQRMINGNSIFTKFLGNTDTIVNALGSTSQIGSLLSQQSQETSSIMSALKGNNVDLSSSASSTVSQIKDMSNLFSNAEEVSGAEDGKSFFPQYAAADIEDDTGNNVGQNNEIA